MVPLNVIYLGSGFVLFCLLFQFAHSAQKEPSYEELVAAGAPCRSFSKNCSQCNLRTDCGYCWDTQECFEGVKEKPLYTACKNWDFGSICKDVSCKHRVSCNDCLATDTCGWCHEKAVCLEGTGTGPGNGECKSSKSWYHAQSAHRSCPLPSTSLLLEPPVPNAMSETRLSLTVLLDDGKTLTEDILRHTRHLLGSKLGINSSKIKIDTSHDNTNEYAKKYADKEIYIMNILIETKKAKVSSLYDEIIQFVKCGNMTDAYDSEVRSSENIQGLPIYDDKKVVKSGTNEKIYHVQFALRSVPYVEPMAQNTRSISTDFYQPIEQRVNPPISSTNDDLIIHKIESTSPIDRKHATLKKESTHPAIQASAVAVNKSTDCKFAQSMKFRGSRQSSEAQSLAPPCQNIISTPNSKEVLTSSGKDVSLQQHAATIENKLPYGDGRKVSSNGLLTPNVGFRVNTVKILPVHTVENWKKDLLLELDKQYDSKKNIDPEGKLGERYEHIQVFFDCFLKIVSILCVFCVRFASDKFLLTVHIDTHSNASKP